MITVFSTSLCDTEEAGKKLAGFLSGGDIVAFRGDMGVGKTSFIKGLAKGLGIESEVTSPSFTLINEYRGNKFKLCHLDAWRLNSPNDIDDIGLFDYIDSGWITAIEWSENLLIKSDFTVTIELTSDNDRTIYLEGKGI